MPGTTTCMYVCSFIHYIKQIRYYESIHVPSIHYVTQIRCAGSIEPILYANPKGGGYFACFTRPVLLSLVSVPCPRVSETCPELSAMCPRSARVSDHLFGLPTTVFGFPTTVFAIATTVFVIPTAFVTFH